MVVKITPAFLSPIDMLQCRHGDDLMKLQDILRNIKKADEDYHMIQRGDRIAVGVSGGKDSMVLLTALHMYSKYPHCDFSVVGIHIDLGFPDMDFHEVDEFCAKHGITLHHEKTSVYEILKKNPDKNGNIQCSLCSKFKKATVIEAAKQYHCNKTAFGHHGDDAVETLLLNAIYGGRIATFQPKMYLTNTKMMFIRPLIYCHEPEIVSAHRLNAIPEVKNTCPNDGYTKRQDMKELLTALYRKYPEAKGNFLSMLHNQQQLDLWREQAIAYDFMPMTQEQMEEIATWQYPSPDSLYNPAADTINIKKQFSQSFHSLYTALAQGEIIGFFAYHSSLEGIEIQLGLRPDLCKLGLGSVFVRDVEAFIITHVNPSLIQLTIASFHQRAIHICEQHGYAMRDTFHQNIDGESCKFYQMRKQLRD